MFFVNRLLGATANARYESAGSILNHLMNKYRSINQVMTVVQTMKAREALRWIRTSDLCHTKAVLFLTELPGQPLLRIRLAY